MADPLSLVASIIAVIGAAETIATFISKGKILRNAPDELLALNNEVSDLTVTLRNIEQSISLNKTESSVVPQEVLQHTSILIDRAKHRLHEIDHLIYHRLLKSGSFEGDYKVFRVRWVRVKSEVESHRAALRDIRQNIVLQIMVINTTRQSHVSLLIDKVFLLSNQIHATQGYITEKDDLNMEAQTRILNRILDGNTQILSKLGSDTRVATQTSSPHLTDDSYDEAIIGVRAHPINCQLNQNVRRCKCNSSDPKRFRSPQVFDHILGALFVGYWGYPFLQQPICSQCSTGATFSGFVNFYFPFWFLKRMLHLKLVLSSFREPFMSLTVRVIVSNDSELFILAGKDDSDGIRHLLDRGGARPNDLDDIYKRNALSTSITARSFRACEVLIAAGSDPYLEDIFGRSAFDNAWNAILSGSGEDQTLQTFARLFPDKESRLERRHFSTLHKVVLGLSPHDLEQRLRLADSAIDELDSYGRTALSWAVQRQNTKATEILLNAKANPNIPSVRGDTPLFHAAFSHNLSLVRLLLHSGASATHKSNNNFSALHYASQASPRCGRGEHVEGSCCSSSQIIELLLAAGGEIEQRDVGGITPLICAARENNTDVVQTLLQHGAQLDSSDEYGDTSLMNAIMYSKGDTVQLLLQKGAKYSRANKAGMTVLHQAARCGSFRTIEILRAANIIGIDPYAKNNDGKTAFELAQQRNLKPKGFIDLFLALLFEIRNRNDHFARQLNLSTGTNTGDGRGDGGLSKKDSKSQLADATESLKPPGAWPRE